MVKAMIVVSLATVTSALGGQLLSSADGAGAGERMERSFLTPRIDGRRLDIRYSATGPADPAMTAEQFCRAEGFDTVVGYSIQPALATRMIGDGTAEFGRTGNLRAFYAIRCATDAEPTVATAP